MTRMILFPALLLSGLAFAADPVPSNSPAPTTSIPTKPTTGATTPISKAVFKDVDKNKDGAVDKTELANIAELIRDFNLYDTDKNGKLSEPEYRVWLDKPASSTGHAVFEDLDTNKDTGLDKAELGKMADLLRDFTVADTDKNGKLNKTEYTAWISKQTQM